MSQIRNDFYGQHSPVEMLLDQVDNDYMDKRVFYHDPCSTVRSSVNRNRRSPSGGALQ
jgi:Fe-S oxidoreductase